MKSSNSLRTMLVTVVLLSAAAASSAEGVKVETVLTGLNTPVGVAVRPQVDGPHEVYVAENGAGRIVYLKSDQPNTSTEVIRGLPIKSADDTATASIGLLFLDRERLVVIGHFVSGDSKTEAAARLYDLPADGKPLTADQMKQDIDLPVKNQSAAPEAGGHFALARTRPNDHVPDMLLVITPAAVGTQDLSRIPVRAGTFGELGVFPLTKGRTPSGVPTAIAVSEQGYVVMNISGGASPSDNHLAFINPIDGAIVMLIKIDLPNVTGLAYSKSTPNLYAISLPRIAGEKGGLYRIDSANQPGKPAAHAVKLAHVENPTAITAGPDGTLYVTDLGKSAGTSTTPGQLLKLTGGL